MSAYFIKLYVLTICVVLAWANVSGAPLKFVPITLKQPDGSILKVYASGDEFYNWVHDKNNYTILPNPTTGFYVYAEVKDGKLVPTEYIVGRVDPQSVGLKVAANVFPPVKIRTSSPTMGLSKSGSLSVFPEPHSPIVGSRFNLVIFVRFKGEPEFTDSLSKYDNLLNGVNGPSLRGFYKETSNNQLDVSSVIYPQGSTIVSYQDTQDRNYYKKYDVRTNPTGYTNDIDSREFALLKGALDFAKAQVPSSTNLDGDNDGFIDNVIFIVSGTVEAWADLLWPHMSYYPYSNRTYAVDINGKKVRNYDFQLQAWTSDAVLDHEMGHTLGLPDLYRYSNTEINPVGPWDVMAATTSTIMTHFMHMSNYMKWKYLGWIEGPNEIKQDGTYWLKKSTSKTNSIYVIKSPRSEQEFFVLEYRSKEGLYETNIPGSGLVVYRVNNRFEGNSGGPPDEIYAYRPYGTPSVDGDISQANFSSNNGRTQINDLTNPSGFLSDGSPGGLSLRNVGATSDSISFDIQIAFRLFADNADYTVETTPYEWIDISQDGAAITNWKNGSSIGSSALDDGYSASAIPIGFEFTYFGQKYSSMYVGINGLVSFSHQFLNFYSETVPTSATQNGYYSSWIGWPGNPYFPNSIAIAYADLDLSKGGKILYKTVNNKFILSWLNVGKSGQVDLTNSFQLVLDNSDGSILMNYNGFGQDATRKQIKVGLQADTAFGVGWLTSGDVVDRIPANNSAIVFRPKSQYTISTTSNPPSFGSTSGGGTYTFGQRTALTVTATPYSGFKFLHWSEIGRIASTTRTYSFSSSSSRNLVANFCVMPSLSVSPSWLKVPCSAGSTKFLVTNDVAGGVMKYSAVSDVGWATVTSGGSKTINGSDGLFAEISYQANLGPMRKGTITVTADEAVNNIRVFEIRQAATGTQWVPWVQCPLSGGARVTCLTTDGTNLFGGINYGVSLSTNSGTSWTNMSEYVRTYGNVNAIAINGTILFAAGLGGSGISRTIDNGAHWTALNFDHGAVRCLLVLSSGIYAGADDGVYLSTNNGDSWKSIGTDIFVLGGAGTRVTGLTSISSTLFAGTTNGVFRSTDVGASWTAASNGLSNRYVTSLGVSGMKLFAGTGSQGKGVFFSDNNGASWVNAGLTNTVVYSLAVSGTKIFAGGDDLYLSTDNGTSWENTAFTGGDVRALAVSGSYLFAGTDSSGVWRLPLEETISSAERLSNELPQQFSLNQNYPNPFNPSTTISYSLPRPARVTLKIFNELGQEIALLVNEREEAGVHHTVWNGNVPSGIYFYRLQAGTFVETKKMILAK